MTFGIARFKEFLPKAVFANIPYLSKAQMGAFEPLLQIACLQRLWKEERAQGEWSSLYLLLVFIIAALILIALIKPMFKRSQTVAKSTPSA